MGSSSTGKKHKKEKKHKHRSRSDSVAGEVTLDLTGGDVGEEAEASSSGRRHHKHKKHKEHKERHKHKHRERSERRAVADVIEMVRESDSDSSDCVEVPVDALGSSEREPPPPPQLTIKDKEAAKKAKHERERRDREKDREKDREREREYERAREKEREHEREREREKELRERERYQRERELEQRRELERERTERERERERERENRERERERAAERERHHRERERDRGERRERSHSPIPENGAGECLSVQETNKLRAKLGLKPLEVESGPTRAVPSSSERTVEAKRAGAKDLAAYKDEWGEFLHKPADNLKERAQAEKLREKLKQRKEKRFLEDRLAHIRTLGEDDDEVDDVSKWVQRNKRVVDQKKEADMRAKALEEMDAEFGVDSLVEQEKEEARRKAYNDKHLKGLRVEHDMDDFAEGKTIILTLKDKDVLDEADGDTLVNVNMMDDERYRTNVDNKKQNPLSYGYNVYEEQYDELGNPIERNILEKYDEDIDGKKKKKNFTIGVDMEEERQHRRKLLEIKTKLAGKRLETLADTKLKLASDTFTEVEMEKFKKPKKKVKKTRQKLKAEDLLPLGNEPAAGHFGSRGGRYRDAGDAENSDEDVSMDSKEPLPPFKLEEEDDDLQRVLAKARKLKQKENLIQKPLAVDVAALKQEIKIEADAAAEDELAENMARGVDGNIWLNATAEFCRTLGDIPTYGMAGNRDEDSNDMMDYEATDAGDERVSQRHEEPELNHGTWNSVNPDEVMRPADLEEFTEDVEEVAILDEEPDVGAGVANALRLALSKGYLEKEEHNRPSNSKMAHLQAKNYSIEDKSSAGDDDKFGRRDRFHAGPIMDFKDKDSFKPNVKLDYIDDNGRILNLKEAFRYLSHKFHGKGPGKNKIEKRLKKMEQEGLMKTMSSTDTPLGTLTMLQQKQKETKTPYVVLSGGKQSANSLGIGSTTSISKYK